MALLLNIPKSMGMKMLIRSMAPEVICADEIGTKEDIEAIKYATSENPYSEPISFPRTPSRG